MNRRNVRLKPNEWYAFRKEIYERDRFCKDCGTARDLTIHHIKPVSKHPELSLEPFNVILLCQKHHYLRENANRKKRMEFDTKDLNTLNTLNTLK